jgi:carbon monoxide dehydrogenase subunit G
MRFQGAIEAGVAPARAWAWLDRPGALAAVLPGLESLEQVNADDLRGVLVASVGPVSGRFEFEARILERNLGAGMVVAVDGVEATTQSRLGARVTLSLAELDLGRTRITYRADVTPEGRLALLGEVVLRIAAGVFFRETSDRIRGRLEALDASGEAPVNGFTASLPGDPT